MEDRYSLRVGESKIRIVLMEHTLSTWVGDVPRETMMRVSIIIGLASNELRFCGEMELLVKPLLCNNVG